MSRFVPQSPTERDGGMVHDGTGAVDGVTRCCGVRFTDLPEGDRVTMRDADATCEVRNG